MSIILTTLAFLSLSCLSDTVRGNCDVTAILPKMDPPLDLSQFNGTWYETITSKDSIASDYACCTFKLVKMETTLTAYEAVVSYYYDRAPKRYFYVDYKTTKDGYFRQRTITENEKRINNYDENWTFDPQAAREHKDMEWKDFTFLGDPHHYLAFVECTPEGLVVWGVTREKSLTVEQLVYVHNDLHKHGISMPIRLGRCLNVTDE